MEVMAGSLRARRGRPALALGLALALGALGAGCASGGLMGPGGDTEARQARAHYNMGVQNLGNGQAALAIRSFRAAVDLQPDNEWMRLGLAEAYRRKGRHEEAERHLESALDIRPGFQQALLNLSALYVQMERYEEAIERADALLDDPTFPAPWQALTNKGWAQMELGRLSAARESLEQALEYDEEHWQALLDLGILEARAGKPDAALERFRQVIALEPGPLARAEVNFRMGEVYASLGERDRALQHWTAAARTRPSGPWGKRSEQTLQRMR